MDIIQETEYFETKMRQLGWEKVTHCKDCIKKEICSLFRDAQQELGYCAWAGRKETE